MSDDVERWARSVERSAERSQKAAYHAEQMRRSLIETVVEAKRAGVSEYELAYRAGVTRQTVRKWLGK